MKNLFKKYQSVFIGIAIVFFMIGAAHLLGLSVLDSADQQSKINTLNIWLSQHKFIVILWHVLLLVAIYWGWSIKVDSLAKQHQLKQVTIDKYKRFRWILIITVVVMDLIMHL